MATIFVSAVDGNNADSGADWANAKQTVAGALAIAVDGDTIKVDSAGAFTANAGITWTPPAGRVAIISVNRAGSDAWLAGAAESVGAASAAFNVAGASLSSMFVFGMTLNGGTNVASACDVVLIPTASVSCFLEMRSCTFDLKTTSTGAQVVFGLSASATTRSVYIKCDSCTFIASGSRAGIFAVVGECEVDIVNPTFSMTGGTKPAALFHASQVTEVGKLTVRDGDASGYSVSGGFYVDVANIGNMAFVFENLKLSGTPGIVDGAWPGGIGYVLLRNCDSADTINSLEYRNAYGTLTENGSIFAAGGAEFNAAGVSWQVVTTAVCNEFFPFVLPPMSVWNSVTSAQTATVQFVKDGATDLTDREIWLEVSYPASASFPNYTAASDRNANPFTGAAVDQPNSGVSWTGTGGFTNENKQTVDVAFTAAEVGLLRSRVSIGKASTTLYVDPKLRVV